MMGDNRDNSADSRAWGPLDMNLVTGKAMFIYFSWNPSSNSIRFSRIGDVIR
jgi:signal peptidase I